MPVKPRLLNPTKAEIEQVDQDKTQYDPLRREAVKVIRRNPKFLLDVQVKWTSMKGAVDPIATPMGPDDKEHGYVVARVADLKKINKTLKRGDVIRSLGGIPMTLYITHIEYGSHYDGEFKLVVATFEDRSGKDG